MGADDCSKASGPGARTSERQQIQRIGDRVHCTFILTFFGGCLKVLILHKILSNTTHLQIYLFDP